MASGMFNQGGRQAPSLAEQGKKLFLARFKHVMVSFASSIQGISDEATRHSYASLVLDRFLVLFFLQRQGLLDNNTHYLQHHLARTHMLQVDTFFAYFFLPLCHTSLGKQTISAENSLLFGHIPALAHPLFQKHATEEQHQVYIADKAFYELFQFLETYRWELISRTDLESYAVHHDIFATLLEQHSNQKQTGTYYTTDDVTAYVAKNTILPALFQRLQKRYPAITQPDSKVWQLFTRSPDRYISAAAQIPASLPEETAQEYQLRQKRYTHLVTLLQQGAVRTINDLITYNLDILRFTVDVISAQDDLKLLVAFFLELELLTILDPTCGSGAFLFAAFSLLETLYMTCLKRIQTLMARNIAATVVTKETKDAHTILAQVASTPGISYFIVHHIITHNLYGVDLMDEAAKVCTLRLYLALLAHTSRIEDVPPLHQVSIHIKTGNSLVGDVYATSRKITPVPMAINIETMLHQKEDITVSSEIYGYKNTEAFHWHLAFPEVICNGGFAAIIGNPPYIEHSKVKHQYAIVGYEEKSCGNLYAAILERSLTLLDPDGSYIGLLVPMSLCSGQRFAQLRILLTQSLSPLWLANFDIFPCRLLGNAFQRLSILLAQFNGTQPLQAQLYTTRIHRWYQQERQFIIDLLTYTHMCPSLLHIPSQSLPLFPKLASSLHAEIVQKIVTQSHGHTIATLQQQEKTPHFVYYQEATNYWIKAVCHIPFYKKNGMTMVPPHGRFLFFADEQTAHMVMAIMNSSLFYVWFATYSDGFHLAHTLVTSFPLCQETSKGEKQITSLHNSLDSIAKTLESDMLTHTRLSTRNKKTSLLPTIADKDEIQNRHAIELTEYQASYSKHIIDEIDDLLARQYDLTSDELDFIISYDKKYRMGHTENSSNT